jgi:WD40 repeat protein
VEQLLTSFDYIQAKIDALRFENGVNQVLADYASAIAADIAPETQRTLVSLATAIRLSTSALSEYPQQTFAQIYSRLLIEEAEALRMLLDTYVPSHPWLKLQSKTMTSVESPLIRTLIGHEDEVLDCTLSSNAEIMLSASKDRTLRVWNLETGLCEHILRGHADQVNACAISADDKLALSASTDRTLRLWDLKTGVCLHIFEGHIDKVTDCAFSRDGSFFVSSSYDKTVRIWEVQKNGSFSLRGHQDRVTCCALSADSKLLLTGSYDKTLRLWNVETRECLEIIEDEIGGITHCALSGDGRVALSTSITYLLEDEAYDPEAGFLPVTIFYNPGDKAGEELIAGAENDFFNALVTSAKNAGITKEILEEEAIIRVWDLSSHKYIQKLKGHQLTISDFDLSKDSKRVISSSSGDGMIKIWDVETGQSLATLYETTAGISGCAIDKNGNLAVSSSNNGNLQIWNVLKAIKDYDATKEAAISPITSCDFNGAGDLAISMSLDNKIQLWSVQDGHLLSQIKATAIPPIEECAINVDQQVAIVIPPLIMQADQPNKELRVIDTQTGHLIRSLSGHINNISSCAIDRAGKIGISASYDGTLRVWSIKDGVCLFILEGHENGIDCCALSSDGLKALSGSDDATLRIWDTTTGQCLYVLQGHSGSIRSCTITKDGQRGLSVGSDNTICIWDILNGILLYKLDVVELSAPCALSNNGRWMLYVAPRRTLHLFDLQIKQEIAVFTFDSNIISAAFSSDRSTIMVSDVSGHTHFLTLEYAGI